MSVAFDDRVFDYVNGALAPADLAAFERDLAGSPFLRAEVEEARELLTTLAAGLTVPAAPAGPRERVLATVRGSVWERFVDAVAHLWDLSTEGARAELRRALDPSTWEDGPVPGVRLFHLDGGPALAGADVGVVSFPPGLAFPLHTHADREIYVVLQGRLFDSTGRVELPGDRVENSGAVRHSFTTDPDEETVIALVMTGALIL